MAEVSHYLGVPRAFIFLFAACVLLVTSGCQQPKRQAAVNVTPSPLVPAPVPKTNAVATPTPPAVSTVPVAPPAAAPVAPVPAPPPAAVDVWVPVQPWSEARGWSAPQRLLAGTNVQYRITTPKGKLLLKAGSKIASLAGVDLWLGFAPQVWNNQLMLHTLDLEKNFGALATPWALPSPPERVLVIDPGHGGANMGTRSAYNKKYEKEYTLDWAKRLKPLAEAKGWKVLLTRTNDVDIALTNRVEFAERHRADLFVSLHFNAAGPTQSGLETYCTTPAGMHSHVTRGYPDDPATVFPNNAFDTANIQYAFRFHQIVAASARLPDRGVRRARFMTVLQGQQRPAVLIEGGYLSNPQEARLIESAAHRQRLAEAVAQALD